MAKLRQLAGSTWLTTACAVRANDVNPARTVTDQAGRQVALRKRRTVAMMFSIPTSLLLALGVRQAAGRRTMGHQTLIESSLELSAPLAAVI